MSFFNLLSNWWNNTVLKATYDPAADALKSLYNQNISTGITNLGTTIAGLGGGLGGAITSIPGVSSTTVDALKSIVKWSEYNADASSYLTLVFSQEECEFKTKYKTLGAINGINPGSSFEVSLPSKNFVNLVEYLSGSKVFLRYSHAKLDTIFNLHSLNAETGRAFDHYIQSVKM